MDIIGLSGQAVSSLIDANEGFYRQEIPSGTYVGHLPGIETLSLETLLITSANADDETVELILDAILNAKRQLQFTHRSFLQQQTDIETLTNSYLHPHPASTLFFQTNRNRL